MYVINCFLLAVRFTGIAVDMTAAAASSVSCCVGRKGCSDHGNARLQTPHLVKGERRIHTPYVSTTLVVTVAAMLRLSHVSMCMACGSVHQSWQC